MVFSFFYLASTSIQDIVAGASGFISGALFITSGLVSLAILNVDESRQRAAEEEIPAGRATVIKAGDRWLIDCSIPLMENGWRAV